MHSSRMRTVRGSVVAEAGGVCPGRGVCLVYTSPRSPVDRRTPVKTYPTGQLSSSFLLPPYPRQALSFSRLEMYLQPSDLQGFCPSALKSPFSRSHRRHLFPRYSRSPLCQLLKGKYCHPARLVGMRPRNAFCRRIEISRLCLSV